MLIDILIILAILIAAVLIYATTRPDHFQVQRSIVIKASPEAIFPLIDDFRAWQKWSPYEGKDPAMQRTFSGAAKGNGAIYGWDGNAQVGKGSIEITDETPPSRVTIKLDMWKPIEGHNIVDFSLQPQGSATNVTWAMRGAFPFISRLMGIFINMDKMIGNDFEIGLAKLKTIVEK